MYFQNCPSFDFKFLSIDLKHLSLPDFRDIFNRQQDHEAGLNVFRYTIPPGIFVTLNISFYLTTEFWISYRRVLEAFNIILSSVTLITIFP
jgi:hypothetical protein